MIVTISAYVVTTLAVPLSRRDHATPGQVTFFLTVDVRAVVWVRFLVWWLPVAVLQVTGHGRVVLPIALLLAVFARLRADRRTLLELVSSSTTSTRNAAQARGGARPGGVS